MFDKTTKIYIYIIVFGYVKENCNRIYTKMYIVYVYNVKLW